jgi:hypothetical protein
MRKNNSYYVVIVILILLLIISCKNVCRKETMLNYPKNFHSNIEIPHIVIDSVRLTKFDCHYYVSLILCLKNLTLCEGILDIDSNYFYLTLKIPESSRFKLFDLNLSIGQSYQTNFNYRIDKEEFEKYVNISVEKIFKDESSNRTVYMFLAKDLYCSDGNLLDIVYFVTRENGVIGSFLSYSTDTSKTAIEYYLQPRGELFEKYIDYSLFKLRVLH